MSEEPRSESVTSSWTIALLSFCLTRYTKRVISDLLQNKVDMSQLVITKALAKEREFHSTTATLWVSDLHFMQTTLVNKHTLNLRKG